MISVCQALEVLNCLIHTACKRHDDSPHCCAVVFLRWWKWGLTAWSILISVTCREGSEPGFGWTDSGAHTCNCRILSPHPCNWLVIDRLLTFFKFFSRMTEDGEHLLSCLLLIHMSTSWSRVCLIVLPFLTLSIVYRIVRWPWFLMYLAFYFQPLPVFRFRVLLTPSVFSLEQSVFYIKNNYLHVWAEVCLPALSFPLVSLFIPLLLPSCLLLGQYVFFQNIFHFL